MIEYLITQEDGYEKSIIKCKTKEEAIEKYKEYLSYGGTVNIYNVQEMDLDLKHINEPKQED